MQIPVGRTIEDGYSFGFRKFFAVLGVVWLPYLLLGILAVFLLGDFATRFLPALRQMSADHAFGPHGFDSRVLAPLHAISGYIWLFTIAALLVTAMVEVGVMRKALGLSTGPTLVYLSFSSAFWRMVGAFVLLWLIWIGLIIGLAIAVGIGAALSLSFVPGNGRYVLIGVAGIIAFCAAVYIIVRLIFFLPAVVVAEERIGIGRSWQLGGGNFWRIFIVAIAIVVPIAFAFWILVNVAESFIPWPEFPHTHDPKEIAQFMLQHITPALPLLIAIALVQRVLTMGVWNGAVASAYRAEVPESGVVVAPASEAAA
jgi:hypothetical protein